MPFWETIPLNALTTAQWESLCDGCGQCCLHKLEDEDTGDLAVTRIACAQLDVQTCRCKNYPQRLRIVPDCLNIREMSSEQYAWLPKTCAYRLLAQSKPLPVWHPLISKTANTVTVVGATISSYAISETEIAADADLEDYIIGWLD